MAFHSAEVSYEGKKYLVCAPDTQRVRVGIRRLANMLGIERAAFREVKWFGDTSDRVMAGQEHNFISIDEWNGA